MFRPMRRFKQQLEEKECAEILKNEKRGVLSLIGDDGYPYGIVLNHWYDSEGQKLYFHGAKSGHKIDSIKKCNKASYTVCTPGYKKEGEWALNAESVVVFGKIKIVDDEETVLKVLHSIAEKFTDDRDYIEDEIKRNQDRVCITELSIEHMSGKKVKES